MDDGRQSDIGKQCAAEARNTHWQVVLADLGWMRNVLAARLAHHFDAETDTPDPVSIAPPVLDPVASLYARWITRHGLLPVDRLIVMLALAPEILPHLLDSLFTKNATYDRGFSEFGGLTGQRHGGFLPTVETALFLLAGENAGGRLQALTLFSATGRLGGAFILDTTDDGPADPASHHREPLASRQLCLTIECLTVLRDGRTVPPEAGPGFPARRLTTRMDWDDLVLPPATEDQLDLLFAWLRHHPALSSLAGLRKHLNPGFKALFYGPPGTGKTLTAALIGKRSGRPVYRVDLSQIVSKYVGETEKNLDRLFAEAGRRDWILFFDEAEALFAHRTDGSSANDRFANQNTAYLLQRLEDCPNLVLLATNLKAGFDPAFLRRFQASIYFPLPDATLRERLWQGCLDGLTLAPDIKLDRIAKDHALAGGSIINIARYAALHALRRDDRTVCPSDIRDGVRLEFAKEGKSA